MAAGLLGRPQEVKRAAVDVVVAAISDGRFDADALGAGLAWLVANDRGKASRLEQPVRDAGRVSARHATGVARAVVSFVAACESTPQGLVGPLTAANELAAATGFRAEGRAERAALERIAAEVSASSKLAARRAGSSARAPRERRGRQRVAFLALLRALPAACCALPLTVCAAPLASVPGLPAS